MIGLKEKTVRGGAARVAALVGGTVVRVGSVMVLARLLEPADFGLIGMVTAFTGVLSLFRDFGLSAATVQHADVTHEETSTLFWINLLVGAVLMAVAQGCAPLVAGFYREPRLLWVTWAVAPAFLLNGAAVQHSALLQREMRFGALALIDIVSLAVGTVVAIGAAYAGYGYWALVAMAVCQPLFSGVGLWLAAGWIPGRPRAAARVRSMMRFGGTVTLNSLVIYVAFNLDRVLLGRFWGTEAIGLYGRANQLIRIPTDSLNSTIGEVAFSALSRIQNDPGRVKRYFLRGYSAVLALTVPITVACALYADDMIYVLLGPKWMAAAPIFRLLAPTILVFAIANPLGWLMNSLGLVARGLKIALFLAPIMIVSYIVGLPYGPHGVALAYSVAMTLWVFPVIAWAVHGTGISFWDILGVVSRPFASVIVAALCSIGLRSLYGHLTSPLLRLVLEDAILFGVYAGILLFVAGQKALYVDLLRSWRSRSPEKEESLASA